jgi:hypothetical protein
MPRYRKSADNLSRFGRALIEPLIQEGYIDRNSYSASVMSGMVDVLWTVGTDPGVYFNPVKSIKSLFSLSDVAATAVSGWASRRNT